MNGLQSLPPIPDTAQTVHGLVAVVSTDDATHIADGDFGHWDGAARIIYLRAGMHPTADWLTFYHEQAHANLDDISPAMPEATLEIVCNAIATSRFAELLASLPPE